MYKIQHMHNRSYTLYWEGPEMMKLSFLALPPQPLSYLTKKKEEILSEDSQDPWGGNKLHGGVWCCLLREPQFHLMEQTGRSSLGRTGFQVTEEALHILERQHPQPLPIRLERLIPLGLSVHRVLLVDKC